MNPLVSVVIPAYNSAAYIGETLESLIRQSFKDWESIVINDCSDDQTVAVVERFRDQRIRLVNFSSRRIVAASRNEGIRRSKGKYVAFLDSDDLWTPDKLADQVRAMESDPGLVLIYSVAKLFGHTSPLSCDYGITPRPSAAALDRQTLLRKNVICCSSVLARVALVREVGGFDEDPVLRAVEDYDLWLRMADRGILGFLPTIHVLYRIHPAGISRDPDAMADKVRYLLHKHGYTPSCHQFREERGLVYRVGRAIVIKVMMLSLSFSTVVHKLLGRPIAARRSRA